MEGRGVVGGGCGAGWEWDGGVGAPADEARGDVDMAFVTSRVERNFPIVVLFVDECVPPVGEKGVDDVDMTCDGHKVERSVPIVVLFVE